MRISTFDGLKKDIQKLAEELKRERDELNMKAHLAKAEIRDEWEKAEESWKHFKGKVDLIGKESKESSHDIKEALHDLAEEIKKSYRRIKKVI